MPQFHSLKTFSDAIRTPRIGVPPAPVDNFVDIEAPSAEETQLVQRRARSEDFLKDTSGKIDYLTGIGKPLGFSPAVIATAIRDNIAITQSIFTDNNTHARMHFGETYLLSPNQQLFLHVRSALIESRKKGHIQRASDQVKIITPNKHELVFQVNGKPEEATVWAMHKEQKPMVTFSDAMGHVQDSWTTIPFGEEAPVIRQKLGELIEQVYTFCVMQIR